MEFNNPTPVAVALLPVIKENEIFLLGVKRGIQPKLGEIALPGGYVDELETNKQAAIRELEEESSFILDVSFLTLFDEAITPQNRLLTFSLSSYHALHDEINWNFVGPETLEVVLIDKNTPICFPTHQVVINRFFNEVAPKISEFIKNKQQIAL